MQPLGLWLKVDFSCEGTILESVMALEDSHFTKFIQKFLFNFILTGLTAM